MHRPSASPAALARAASVALAGASLATALALASASHLAAAPSPRAQPTRAASAPVPPPEPVPSAPVATGASDPESLPAPRIWWPLDSVLRRPPGQQPAVGPAPPSEPISAAGPVAASGPTPSPDLVPAAGPREPVEPRQPVEPDQPDQPIAVAVTRPQPAAEPQPRAPAPQTAVIPGPSTSQTAKKGSGRLVGTELVFGLAPDLAIPRVQTTLPETGLAPPTPDVRRWTFAAPDGGLTWESQESSKEGEWIVLRGQVDIRAGVERIQADEVRLSQETMTIQAEGNVILDRLDSRMAGSRLEYDVRTNTGVMHEAFGTTGEDISFTADVAEKVGPDKYLLRTATFTSCMQPGPLWQVKATKAIVQVGSFVYMWNPRVVFGKVPAFYLPWVAIPIEDKRSTGFMIPKVGNSSTRGFTVGEEFFWAINRQVDLTLGATYWDKFGYRADAEARWFLGGMPEYGFIKGAFVHATDEYLAANAPDVDDPSKAQDRYDVVWEHRQSFGEWDLTATGEIGSDQFVNYDLPGDEGIGDLRPIFNQKFTFQRSFGRHGLNITAENNEQESELTEPSITPAPDGDRSFGNRTDVDRKLPSVEYRSSGLQLGGKKWTSLSMEASAARIQQVERTTYGWDYDTPSDVTYVFSDTTMDHSYERADFYPQLRLPLGTPWLQVIPEVNVRASWWSRRELDPRLTPQAQPIPTTPPTSITVNYVEGVDDGLLMWGWDAGLALEGPDFSRIFNLDALAGQRKWQHLIEPSIEFAHAPEIDEETIILGDQYRSHWFQRFRTPDPTSPGQFRSGTRNNARLKLVNTLRTKVVAEPGDREDQARDWLIWTLSTDYDFEKARSVRTIDGRPETNWWADLQSDLNFKPTDRTHFSLRNTYDVLQDDVTSTSLVGGVGGDWGYVDLSLRTTRDATTLEASPGDASVTGEHWFYKGDRIRIGYDLAYKFNEKPPASPTTPEPTPWLYKRFVVSYYNQCLGFSLSWEDQALRGTLPREQEWIFTVSLKDLGNYLRYKRSKTLRP